MGHLTIINSTGGSISYLCNRSTRSQEELLCWTTLLPAASTTVEVAALRSGFMLCPGSNPAKSDFSYAEKQCAYPNGFSVRLPMSFGASWKAVRVADDCPWRLYRSKITRSHHRLLIIPRRNLGCFLSDIPDSVPLSSLLLPGTHDTMALYGWPISQCQSLDTPLAVQLQSGIRVLDIRLAVKESGLMAYHGLYPQRVSFQSILATIHDYLTSPESCGETLVMSIKQEDFINVSPAKFSAQVHDEITRGPGGMAMWFLDNRIPTLGEARGKVVMFSRFGGAGDGWEGGLEGIGVHPTKWPDSAKDGFSWVCKNTTVRTHDWYNIPSFLSIPEKVDRAEDILLPPKDDSSTPILSISFFSAASFPLAFPPTIARGFGWPKLGFGVEGVNSRLGQWLIDKMGGDDEKKEPRIRGWVFMDFFQDPEDNAVVPLLVECNFRGRIPGEEGWS